jgi:hypothetical protein
MRVAYHEAGHALAAWKLGIRFTEVSILPVAHQGDIARGLKLIEQERGTTAMHTAAAVFLLAGQCGQMRWDPNTDHVGCDEDRSEAGSHANALLVQVKKFEDLADELVRTDWERLQALAAALLDRQTMSGVDAVSILDSMPAPSN